MNIILFGPPGAGKGTQADNLVKFFKLHKVSTGDLLRKEINNNTDLSKKIKLKVDKGLLVPDSIINSLILEKLSDNRFYNRLIFDGYPRNITQAKNLDLLLKKYNQKISCVFSLNINKGLIVKRILGREICIKCGVIFNKYFKPAINKSHTCDPKFLDKRSDDNESTITNRYETYRKKTLPVLNFYKQRDLLRDINAKAEIDQIFEEIRAIMTSLEA